MSLAILPDRQPTHPPPRPLVDPKSRLILFWMHRCGSTTGQRWFFEIAGWKDRMAGKGAGELSAMWHAEHPDVYENLHEYYRDPSFIKVAIVRHPLLRAVSSFTVVTDSKSSAQWRAVAKSLPAPDEERRLTFLEFLDFLGSENLATANYHWRLQSAQEWHDIPVADIRLVPLESIQAGLDGICRMLGKQPQPLRINSAQSTRRVNIPPSDIVNFTRRDFARAFGYDKRGVIRFPEYAKFLTPRTIGSLAQLYERDFAELGYEPVLPQKENWSAKFQRLFRPQ
ncbi:MAG: sulfotransferase family 2 domain-containing protein [Rhizomicrobium sp.]